MIVFGGFSSTYLNDIWAFDLDTHAWANVTPSAGSAPAPRLTPASICDPAAHRMITWSGQGPGVFFNDVWAFDLTTLTWSQFSPAGGPPNVRYGVGHTFNPVAAGTAGTTPASRWAPASISAGWMRRALREAARWSC